MPFDLPMAERPANERRDAAENRLKVLEAAERVFAREGVVRATMGQVAREAGVGRATLYRRYPGLGDLALALLDQRERELQEGFLRGPPPLGPGAPAADRLVAFGHALLGLLESHGDLVRLAEGGAAGAWFSNATYRSYHVHVVALLREARGGAVEAEWLAHALLAALAADLHGFQRARGMSLRQARQGWEGLARALAEV